MGREGMLKREGERKTTRSGGRREEWRKERNRQRKKRRGRWECRAREKKAMIDSLRGTDVNY